MNVVRRRKCICKNGKLFYAQQILSERIIFSMSCRISYIIHYDMLQIFLHNFLPKNFLYKYNICIYTIFYKLSMKFSRYIQFSMYIRTIVYKIFKNIKRERPKFNHVRYIPSVSRDETRFESSHRCSGSHCVYVRTYMQRALDIDF